MLSLLDSTPEWAASTEDLSTPIADALLQSSTTIQSLSDPEAQRLLAEAQRLQTKLSEHVRQLLQQKEAADAPCLGGLPPPPPLGYRHFLPHS